MKLCFVCSEYPPGEHGGIGTFTHVLAQALSRAGHLVRVVGVYPMTGSSPQCERQDGVEVWRLPQARWRGGWLWDRYRLYRIVARWAEAREIELVEIPDYDGWGAGWPHLPIPMVARLHGSSVLVSADLGRPESRGQEWLERISLHRADAWCAVSHYTARRSRSLFGLRGTPEVLYPPVDVPEELGPGLRSRHDVVFTGTLSIGKGVVSLVTAWPQVRSACPQAELHLFGKDRPDAQGDTLALALRSSLNDAVGGSVTFHGHVPRDVLFEALRRARVAVFPSFAESFANAPLEAMAWGCPTIYTRRCSGPELIHDGLDGLLVDPGDPPEIANAIITVLRDGRLANRLGEAGRKRVRELCALDRVMAQNEVFYEDCLRRFRPVMKRQHSKGEAPTRESRDR